jgi:hypothetical protein
MIRHDCPVISVVIINHNGLGYLRRSIWSILRSNYSFFEIIVVDNGSSDGSVQCIQEEFAKCLKRIIVVPLRFNQGYAVGNNIGASKASGEYILFLNNDTEVDPSCLKELVNTMEHDASIGAAQAKILFMDRKDTFDSAGVFLNVVGCGRTRGYNEKDRGQYASLDEISYAKGAAIVVRRDVYNRLEGFDQSFFTYFEETDLCWRVWLCGYRVVFVPSAKVFHAGSATISKRGSSKFNFQFYRNRLITVVKNLSVKNLVKYSPWLVIAYMIRITRYTLDNDAISVVGIIRGIFWCIRYFKSVWTKRLIFQQLRIVNDESLFRKGVISRSARTLIWDTGLPRV